MAILLFDMAVVSCQELCGAGCPLTQANIRESTRDVAVVASKRPQPMGLYDQIQALLWIFLAAAVAFYGNGESDLVRLVLQDGRLNRFFINAAFGSVGINVTLFLYVYIWLEGLRGHANGLKAAKWIGPAGGTTFALAVVSFILGLWPLFGILSLPIVIVETYGFVLALHFAPTFGVLRVRRGHQQRNSTIKVD